MRLRQKLATTIKELFHEHVTITHLPNRTRSILLIDNTFMVSILLCRTKRKRGRLCWEVDPNPAERDCATLLCTMNFTYDRVIDYFHALQNGWVQANLYARLLVAPSNKVAEFVGVL
jgi:hypothetical protein